MYWNPELNFELADAAFSGSRLQASSFKFTTETCKRTLTKSIMICSTCSSCPWLSYVRSITRRASDENIHVPDKWTCCMLTGLRSLSSRLEVINLHDSVPTDDPDMVGLPVQNIWFAHQDGRTSVSLPHSQDMSRDHSTSPANAW